MASSIAALEQRTVGIRRNKFIAFAFYSFFFFCHLKPTGKTPTISWSLKLHMYKLLCLLSLVWDWWACLCQIDEHKDEFWQRGNNPWMSWCHSAQLTSNSHPMADFIFLSNMLIRKYYIFDQYKPELSLKSYTYSFFYEIW